MSKGRSFTIGLIILGITASAIADGQRKIKPEKPMTPKAIYRRFVDSIVHIYIKDAQGKEYDGTGFLVNNGSQVATCHHVIDGAVEIVLKGTKEAQWRVVHVKFDSVADLALLTLDAPSKRESIECVDVSSVEPGDPVCVIGNSVGILENSLSTGIVSGLRIWEGRKVLQFTAPISHGNSGGPVFDSYGHVVALAQSMLGGGNSLFFGSAASGLKHLPNSVTWEQFANLSRANAVVTTKPSKDQQQFVRDFAAFENNLVTTMLNWQIEYNFCLGNSGEKDEEYLEASCQGFETALASGSSMVRASGNQVAGLDLSDLDDRIKNLQNSALSRVKAEVEFVRDMPNAPLDVAKQAQVRA